jgi:hypothetical protein
MPAPPDNHQNGIEIISVMSNALSSFWAWLLPMIAGIFHMGRMQQRINQMETQTADIMEIKLDIKELKTKVDILLNSHK